MFRSRFAFWTATIVALLLSLTSANPQWCPPQNFVGRNKDSPGAHTAIIADLHGEIYVCRRSHDTPSLDQYFPGDYLSRFIHHNVAVMGVDKLYLTVMYNSTLHPTPPTLLDIYPANESCTHEWYKKGVIEWRTIPFGVTDLWKLPGFSRKYHGFHPLFNRTCEKNAHKTLLGYNPTYEVIKKDYDWVFVLDVDEYLLPVNHDTNQSDWCSPKQPSLVSQALVEMTEIATKYSLYDYGTMNRTRTILSARKRCELGYQRSPAKPENKTSVECRPLTAFKMPVYTWQSDHTGMTQEIELPQWRSPYPCNYLEEATPYDGNNFFIQGWKSVYHTKNNPPLTGKTLHFNTEAGSYPILAPRAWHGGKTLELAHMRVKESAYKSGFTGRLMRNRLRLLGQDTRLVDLNTNYNLCLAGAK